MTKTDTLVAHNLICSCGMSHEYSLSMFKKVEQYVTSHDMHLHETWMNYIPVNLMDQWLDLQEQSRYILVIIGLNNYYNRNATE